MHSYLSMVLPKQVQFWPLIWGWIPSSTNPSHNLFLDFFKWFDVRLETREVLSTPCEDRQVPDMLFSWHFYYIIRGFTKVGSIPSLPCSSIGDWSDHFSFLLMVTPANMSTLSSGTLLMEYTYTWTKVELSHSHCILQLMNRLCYMVQSSTNSLLISVPGRLYIIANRLCMVVGVHGWGQSVH